MIRREDLRKVGFYIVILLALANFVIKPLQIDLKHTETRFYQLKQTYLLRKELYEKRLALTKSQPKKDAELEHNILALLYPKSDSYTIIRGKLMKSLTSKAEEKNLVVQSFEFLEVKRSEYLSEIPISLRLKGQIKPLLELIKELETSEKLILVRQLEISPSRPDYNINLMLSVFRSEL